MKAGVLAVAAAIAAGVSADHHAARRHAHKAFHLARHDKNGTESTCSAGCTTIYSTIIGAMTLHTPVPTTTTTSIATSSSTVTVVKTSPNAPVNSVSTYSETGTYTIPATTVTVTCDTVVPEATTTTLTSAGTWSAGGVTTTVTAESTVTCPYATTDVSEGVTTTVIKTTTYVCPSAGTYTIAPLTTTCSESTVWVYPTAASVTSGTYTRPEQTVTVTKPNYVYICPFATGAPTSSVAAVVSPPEVTSTPAAAPVVVASSAAPVIAVSVSVAAVSSPSSSSLSSTIGSALTGTLGSSGDQWGLTYTPYTPEGNCKTKSEVDSDISKIAQSNFLTVRVYSTDCSALENIGSACKEHGLKMILGVFISSTGISGAQEQVDDIVSWGQFDLVELCVVGNEAISSGYASASALAGFISSTASAMKGAGYTGPFTTAETLNVWQANAGTLCGVVDYVGCNIHPFFNSATSASQAGDFVAQEMSIAADLCGGKEPINLETGWPTAGEANGLAVPGISEQAEAIASIKAKVGGKSVMFSFVNDLWKAPGAFGCEQSWGAFHLYGSI